jgi:serine/threonine-protein kinase RsbW
VATIKHTERADYRITVGALGGVSPRLLKWSRMTDERWLWSSEQHIPSVRHDSHRLLAEIVAQLEQHAWPREAVYGIQLSLEEALANAIRHGNQLDQTKRVRLLAKVSRRRAYFEVADEGAGFVPLEVPDPTSDDNLDKASGRGILLMRSYMTRVEYNAAGNLVVLEKELSPEP